MIDETQLPAQPIETPESAPFYFDDFFDNEDGIEVTLLIRGRHVPIRIRKGLTLRERVKAEGMGITRHLDMKTGRVVIDGVDEAAAAEEIAFQMLLSWPFVNRDGSPVPITRPNVAKLLGGMDQLVQLTRKMETEGEAALVPFVSASASPSAPAAPSDQ
jgi:hypothetical protein